MGKVDDTTFSGDEIPNVSACDVVPILPGIMRGEMSEFSTQVSVRIRTEELPGEPEQECRHEERGAYSIGTAYYVERGRLEVIEAGRGDYKSDVEALLFKEATDATDREYASRVYRLYIFVSL
ncbi:hypothetical protein KIPB_009972, partial [Kipferlia bialata]|eukprot:g9972.t1